MSRELSAGTAGGPRIVWRPMNETRTERPLGRSGICVPTLGVGTNRWDTSGPGRARLTDTLSAALDAGMGFFDTAEVYSAGRSELARARLPGVMADLSCWPASSRHLGIGLPRRSSRQRWKRH